jgi:hypothetical protein
MNRYRTHRSTPALALAAAAATALTMAAAVVLPARMQTEPGAETLFAQREARQPHVDVVIERIDVVASQPAVVVGEPVVPSALAERRG